MCSKANALPSERVIERDASMRVACNSALAWMLELLSSVVSLSLFLQLKHTNLLQTRLPLLSALRKVPTKSLQRRNITALRCHHLRIYEDQKASMPPPPPILEQHWVQKSMPVQENIFNIRVKLKT